MTAPGKIWVPEEDSKWIRLVKVWKDEGIITKYLAERFGYRKNLIEQRLRTQFGTISAKTFNKRGTNESSRPWNCHFALYCRLSVHSLCVGQKQMKPKSKHWYQYRNSKRRHFFVHDGLMYLTALCKPDHMYDNGTGENLSNNPDMLACKTCLKLLDAGEV